MIFRAQQLKVHICIHLLDECIGGILVVLCTFENDKKYNSLFIPTFSGSLVVSSDQVNLLRDISVFLLVEFGRLDIFGTEIENSYIYVLT